MKTTILFAILLATLAGISSAQAITIPTVPVGDVGNPNDPATGNLYGGVSYAYNIGTTEVTLGQYTSFLNSVAATDTYSLYNTAMATDLNIAGIARSGASGSYSYSVVGSPNHPVTYISWGDAVRFANWLHNGQPSGDEGPGITETGAYALNGATTDAALMAVTRNAGAKWFIPTENEWYKAAYFEPAAQGGDSDDYWMYPMKTNSVPYSDQPPGATPDNTRAGNVYQDDHLANGYDDGYAVCGLSSPCQNYLTDVGAYSLASSYYGTFDQAGNVAEWIETAISFPRASGRGVLGGYWGNNVSSSALNFGTAGPSNDLKNVGFRVASIPEPGTLLLTAMASVGLLLRRER